MLRPPTPPGFVLAALLLSAPAAGSQTPSLILSEILADPAALPDAEGEFLEWGHPGSETAFLEGLSLSVDGQSLELGAVSLAPGACLLICRDSAAYAAAGIACDRGWPSLSLANSRSLAAAASWSGGRFQVTVPAARPGVSWENTWKAEAGFAEFLPARGARGGDSATPGARNSRSALPPSRDLALSELEILSGRARVVVEDRGTEAPAPAMLSLRLDADWDGEAETPLDSVRVEGSAPLPAVFEFALRSDRAGRLVAGLGPDDDPGNNALSARVEPDGGPLGFVAAQAAPGDGEPEWIEIRNVSLSARGGGRRISLERCEVGGMEAGSGGAFLDPGQSLFLVSDTAAFRSRFGFPEAKVRRPSGWRALRNTGDTLVLALDGVPADTLSWGSLRPGGSPPASDGSGRPARADWSLSGRAAFPDAPLLAEVFAPEGDDYVLRAFDLEGNPVREIGRGGPGRRIHAWDGRGEGGRSLPRGPYVLCLTFGRSPARKRAVAAGER